MHEPADGTANSLYVAQRGRVDVMSRAELVHCRHWRSAFVGQRKDHRFYELVEDTIRQGFDYQYFVIKDRDGEVQAVQPFFILDQDLLAGINSRFAAILQSARRMWPKFLKMRTLMVGCAVGEGCLDDMNVPRVQCRAPCLRHCGPARALKAPLIVLKEFPARYRKPLLCFLHYGFSRVPSLPMTRLNIEYPSSTFTWPGR